MLKRAPLHARVKSLPNPDYAGCLFLGWISLHLSLSILGAAVIASSFDAVSKGLALTLMIVCTILPTFFVARVVFPPKRLEHMAAWRRSWPMELLADLLIVSAVSC
jgi:hypothetical protein